MSNADQSTWGEQIFTSPITEVIKGRSSKRTYQGIPLSEEEKTSLLSFINEGNGISNAPVRFGFVEAAGEKDMKLGTYGVIKGAKTFLVSASEDGDFNMEELGYRMEKGVLYATAKGWGTCWLAGTFNRNDFGKAIGLKMSERIPAISPVGLATEKRRFIDSTMRSLVGSTSRKPWEELFFSGDFSKSLKAEEIGGYSEVLEMVRIGPSASNKQPWRIVKSGENYHFYLAHTKNYPSTAQRMDLGIAACHFEFTAKEMGLNGKFEIRDPKIEVPQDIEYIISWSCEA